MAFSFIHYNTQLPHGNQLRSALSGLENGLDGLIDACAVMTMMVDGDGSQAAHFEQVMTRYGFADLASSKAAFDELNSLKFKLTTDSSVTEVNAALLQAFNKFRN